MTLVDTGHKNEQENLTIVVMPQGSGERIPFHQQRITALTIQWNKQPYSAGVC